VEFKQLETFISVARLKSFSKAAKALYLTQPTVSNHIQWLEQELQTILFNRNNNKDVTLTKAGEVFFQHALELLNKKESALFSLREYKGKIEGTLEISASTIPGQHLLPGILSKFNKKYPHVAFKLMKYDSQQVIDKLLSGEIDFGFVGFKKESSQLDYIEVMKDRIILTAPNHGKYSAINEISLDELHSLALIFRETGSGTRKVVEAALQQRQFVAKQLKPVAIIENTQTIKECVKGGLGLTFISAKAVVDEIEQGIFKEISVDGLEITRSFYFVYHKSRALSPLATAFKDFVLRS